MRQSLDPDTRAVTALIRDAMTVSGLPQGTFARAMGTSASRFSTYLAGSTRPSAHFCLRAQRLSRSLEAAADAGLMSAPLTADALRQQLRADRREWAWRMLLQGRDHLRLMLSKQVDDLLGSWEAAPTSTGSVEYDTLLAALTRHEFEASGRTAPDWTNLEPLPAPWVPDHPFLSRERAIAKTPDWLKELNIFVPGRDLVTA